MAATRTLTRDGTHVYVTLAATGGVWECPIDFESEALAEGWVYTDGPPGVQVGSAPLTQQQAATTYVRFRDTSGNPVSGEFVTIVVDTTTNEVTDITVQGA